MILLPHHVLKQRSIASVAANVSAWVETVKESATALVFRGTNGEVITVAAGDGSAVDEVTLLGPGTDATWNHDYTGVSGTKRIVISGNIDAVTRFSSNSQGLTAYNLNALKNLDYLKTVNDSNLVGDIESLRSFPGLTYVEIQGTKIGGNLSSIAGLTSLQYIFLQDSEVVGDLSSLSELTATIQMALRDDPVTGDLSDLSALTNLTHLWVYNTDIGCTTDALAEWGNITLQAHNCNWTSTEVDNCLNKLNDAGGTGGTLKIDGNNASRTSASDAALIALLGNGWSVTVNE
jgi:hypothetical protein